MVPDLPGTRSTQAGRGVILPACQVHDAGELTRAPAASVLVMPHVLVNPQHLHPCEMGGIIRSSLQARLDMGPHGIPRGCQLSSQSCNSGSLKAQLSDRPADRPHTQTRPGSTYRVVLLDEGRDLAGLFATYPALLKPPDPRRDPGPGRVNHLHHHASVTLWDHPTTRAANQLVARLNIEHQSPWGASYAHQMEALQGDEQITPITTIKRHRAAAGRERHHPRSLTTAGVEVRSSSRTSTSTRTPPDQHPVTHTQLERATKLPNALGHDYTHHVGMSVIPLQAWHVVSTHQGDSRPNAPCWLLPGRSLQRDGPGAGAPPLSGRSHAQLHRPTPESAHH